MKITLPWPPSILSPNCRAHWAKKNEAKKAHRNCCYVLAGCNVPLCPAGPINLTVRFRPPDKRKRDLDNMLASNKSTLDAIAEAWGVDDSRFRLTLEIGDPVKFGAVEVSV